MAFTPKINSAEPCGRISMALLPKILSNVSPPMCILGINEDPFAVL